MVIIIAAMDQNRGIGKDNRLMWSLPADMAFFKAATLHQTVIMGRKNYESIPFKFRPLPNRLNIVITRNPTYKAPGCLVVNNLKDALSVKPDGDQYVIGGAQIYQLALDHGVVDKLLLTHINGEFDADTFFPRFESENWAARTLLEHEADLQHKYSFKIVEYLNQASHQN